MRFKISSVNVGTLRLMIVFCWMYGAFMIIAIKDEWGDVHEAFPLTFGTCILKTGAVKLAALDPSLGTGKNV